MKAVIYTGHRISDLILSPSLTAPTQTTKVEHE
jgi:hypothetical protein